MAAAPAKASGMESSRSVAGLVAPDAVASVAAFRLGPGGRSFTGVPVVLDNGWIAR